MTTLRISGWLRGNRGNGFCGPQRSDHGRRAGQKVANDPSRGTSAIERLQTCCGRRLFYTARHLKKVTTQQFIRIVKRYLVPCVVEEGGWDRIAGEKKEGTWKIVREDLTFSFVLVIWKWRILHPQLKTVSMHWKRDFQQTGPGIINKMYLKVIKHCE